MMTWEAMMRDEGYTLRVDLGGNAVATIVNPWGDPHLEWMLRYAADLNDTKAGRFSAASVLDTFDYLLSDAINMTEATRRLRLLRKARTEALKAGAAGVGGNDAA
jgi:hypothetical protein